MLELKSSAGQNSFFINSFIIRSSYQNDKSMSHDFIHHEFEGEAVLFFNIEEFILRKCSFH